MVQIVITVFHSRLRQDHADDFHTLANRKLTLAKTMRGFVSYRSFASEDAERCSVIEFDSPEHLRAWPRLIAVFVRFAEDHPERRHGDFVDVALASLKDAFPCHTPNK